MTKDIPEEIDDEILGLKNQRRSQRMPRKLAIVLMLLLSGCSGKSMSSKEVIAAAKECKEGGLRPVLIRNWDAIIDVECWPWKEK